LKGATQADKDLATTALFTSELAHAGAAVIVTSLAPKHWDQNQFLHTVLHGAGTGANVFHVHVTTPLGFAKATDRRQVYARARRGESVGLPGVSVEYKTPETPHLSVDVTNPMHSRNRAQCHSVVRSELSCGGRFYVCNTH